MAKYDALGAHLGRRGSVELELAFDEIERIVGSRLPDTASRPQWSANETEPGTRHVQCRSWPATRRFCSRAPACCSAGGAIEYLRRGPVSGGRNGARVDCAARQSKATKRVPSASNRTALLSSIARAGARAAQPGASAGQVPDSGRSKRNPRPVHQIRRPRQARRSEPRTARARSPAEARRARTASRAAHR